MTMIASYGVMMPPPENEAGSNNRFLAPFFTAGALLLLLMKLIAGIWNFKSDFVRETNRRLDEQDVAIDALQKQNIEQAGQIAQNRYENYHLRFQAAKHGVMLAPVIVPPRGMLCGRVLLVDDDLLPSRAMKFMLEFRGLEVTTATTIAETINRIDVEHYDVILLDLMMPDGTGDGVLDHIRKLNLKCPVAISTGCSREDDAFKRADAFKPDATFFKPIDIEEVTAWVAAQASAANAAARN